MTRPLREVIAESIWNRGAEGHELEWADDNVDREYWLCLADAAIAALPQTEGSETVLADIDALHFEGQTTFYAEGFNDALDRVSKLIEARQALALPVDGWRPEVRAFADLMEAQLRKNDHKGGWQNDRPHALLKRLYDEAAELGHAMPYDDDFDPENVGWEAADVANFAMMIADVCGALPAPPAPDRGGEDGKN